MALPGHIMKHRKWLSMMMILKITPNSATSECVTVDNRICIFPFNYQNQTYAGCTGEGAPDGMLWCSTKVNSEGDHMAGQGEWGHCAADCPSAWQRTNPDCRELEVSDQVDNLSSGLYSVHQNQSHEGRALYINQAKNLVIFWVKRDAGWSLGNQSGLSTGESFYTSGPEVEGEPWQGAWRESKLKIFCSQDLPFIRSVPRTAQEDKKCLTTESCLTRENCPAVEKLYQQLDGKRKEDAVKRLRANVCNLRMKAFCCKTEDSSICQADESCKEVSECPEVKEIVGQIKSGNLPFRESITIYENLKARLCDKQKEKFCCKENTAGTMIPNNYETSSPRTNLTANVYAGTFLPLASDRMCANANQTASLIINGKNSKPGQYPFMALLGRKVRKRRHNGRIRRFT